MANLLLRLRWVILATLLLAAGCEAGDAGAGTQRTAESASPPYEKHADAIELLRRADAKIRGLKFVEFHSEYRGLFTTRGLVRAKVIIRRDLGDDEDLQTVKHALSARVEMPDPPYGYGQFPRRFTLTVNDRQAQIIDDERRSTETAEGFDRNALAFVVSSAVLPQYLRVDPLKLEIEDSIGARIVGEGFVGAVRCDILWLKFDDDSGFGEQLLYLGKTDQLLRKATVVTPRSAAGPLMLQEIQLTEFSIPETVPDDQFDAATPEGYAGSVFRAAEVSVGVRAPTWRLPKLGGGTVGSGELSGNVAVLFFWASWCPTCHAFFPEFQEKYEKYRGSGVRFVAINVFDNDDPAGYVAREGFTFDVALGGDAVVHEFRFIGQPAIVVLDENGIIRHRQLGALPASDGNPRIWAAVDSALREAT